MNRLLDLFGRVATRAPAVTLTALLVTTIVLGALATRLEVDTGLEGFAPADGVADTLDAIGERFEAGESVQIHFDAGPGGNVLARDVLAAVDALGTRIEEDPTVAAVLQPERSGQPPVVTFAYPFAQAADAMDETLDDLAEPIADLLVETLLDEAYDDLSPLLSDDLDPVLARARSGIGRVAFDTAADDADVHAASVRVGEIVAGFDHPGLRTGVVSMAAIEDAIESSLMRDLPVLMGTSMLLVLLVLALVFRSASDVALGFLGLVSSIVWMAGSAVLLGPRFLGVIGDFTQVAVAVPVLLIGLGIDYSVHLTTRYREQRGVGDQPATAAHTAVVTVGFALVLATIASVAGFLANVATPLPPIRDFGILAAVGIVSAFVILGGLVPAARTLLDRRRPRRSAAAIDTRAGDPWWVRATIAIATRAATPALIVTGLALVLGAVAATGLSTEFNDRDFLPSGEPVNLTLDRLETQFGGDVGERTFVLVDGDPRDPALLEAAATFEDGLLEIEWVRPMGGRAETVSPFFFVEVHADLGERVRDRIADDIADWADPEAAAAAVRLPAVIDESFVDDADELDLPDGVQEAIERRLGGDRTALAALLRVMDDDEILEMAREAIAEQIAEDRPATLDDASLATLVALAPHELSAATLTSAGYPLTADDRDALSTLERLERAGWDGERPEDGSTWGALFSVVGEVAPAELSSVLDTDGLLLSIATSSGQDHVQELADELDRRVEAIRVTGAEVTVASGALMQAEIISSLSAAQLQAILISLLAAAVLLVVASLVTSRSVGLGLIGIVPSLVALVLVLGAMRVVGIPFNAMTATVASIAVGIGVPYGIHLINRFRESRARGMSPDVAIADTLRNTGPALVGSAITTGLAFGVLVLSESMVVTQFGRVSFLMIGFALLACLLVQPALLVLWARRRDVRARR
jgi:predicted RND superfamily exporter protein